MGKLDKTYETTIMLDEIPVGSGQRNNPRYALLAEAEFRLHGGRTLQQSSVAAGS